VDVPPVPGTAALLLVSCLGQLLAVIFANLAVDEYLHQDDAQGSRGIHDDGQGSGEDGDVSNGGKPSSRPGSDATWVAAMFKDAYPVRWIGRQAVVALPEHIDTSNASQIREELLWVINRGAAALIADMTATLSCDQSGAEAVMRAYQRARASGIKLRLVVTAQIVRHVLGVNGLDRLISVYPTVETATAAGAP
jgi:anti-sigma B factor antagonist